MDYEVFGFDCDASHVIFKKNEKFLYIKSTLPKVELIAYLDIIPKNINKYFKDEILDKARINGRFRKGFSKDGKQWFKFMGLRENGTYKELEKYFHVDEWRKLKD